MDLADLPSVLLQDILFRAARGATAERVAKLMSVCELFRREIKICSVKHKTHARPKADQPLKLRDCAALKSLFVIEPDLRFSSGYLDRSGTAVALQALTSLTIAMPIYSSHQEATRFECIIKAAPALAVLVLKNAHYTLFTCLGSLHALKSLKFLNNYKCRINGEDSAAFSDLSDLLQSIMHLTTLQDLYISCCGCYKLPNSIGQLTALQMLSLAGSVLLGLPDSIRHLTALQTLDLCNCLSLTGLPDIIGQMTALTELDLDCLARVDMPGSLTGLPDSIGQLAALEILKLGGQPHLVGLPDSIGHLTTLQMLNLSQCCGLVRLPDSIGHLTALQTLDLSQCCRLVGLPDSIGQMTALTKLDLVCGLLKDSRYNYSWDVDTPWVADSPGSLICLPYSIGQLAELEILSLRGQIHLVQLPDSIGHLTALQMLDLSLCRGLVGLPDSIGHLTALQTLNLSRCDHIELLPDSIGHLNALQTVNLSDHRNL